MIIQKHRTEENKLPLSKLNKAENTVSGQQQDAVNQNGPKTLPNPNLNPKPSLQLLYTQMAL